MGKNCKRKLISILLCAAMICSIGTYGSISVSAAETKLAAAEGLRAIEGLDGVYIKNVYENLMYIVNEDGEELLPNRFRWVDTKLNEYDTLYVEYATGMSDASPGLLSKDLEYIVPHEAYLNLSFFEQNNNVYVRVEDISGNEVYYNLEGDKLDAADLAQSVNQSYSEWAESSILEAIGFSLIPQDLQSSYTSKITRREFCRLAMQMYVVETSIPIDEDAETPFTDVDDTSVTAAYEMNIVSGVGNGKFAPDNYITRQEAAVMLCNLAEVLEIKYKAPRSQAFADESYFASWARSAIYSVSAITDGDTYLMAGTGNNKFSPWMNYTREQAIVTIYRLYDIASHNH